MNFSRPFIERPIGTTLLAIGLILLGCVAYIFLPVASMPSVEFPTIRVNANLPGADPDSMAALVAAPLERHLGEIPGVTEMTSRNSLGSTRITLQFALNRGIEGAAQDVQAAINAAAADLPADMPSLPSFRKSNPAAAPILILALTSETVAPSGMYDVADTVIAQRISQIDGVAEVTVSGADQPAIRVRANPRQLAAMGLSIEDVRLAITRSNALAPLGIIDGDRNVIALETNGQLRTVDDYKSIIVKSVAGGAVVRLADVASVEQGTRNSRSLATFNGKPAILLTIIKGTDANVIETVDRIRELIPELKRWVPAGMEISVLSDRTTMLRASVFDMQLTLGVSIVLVMMIVYVFLRRPTPTIAAGITVPLSLAGTFAAMWLAGFSINNLTLMALAVSVGLVVDDAIVMIENVYRNLEKGWSPIRAALEGAQQIGFTVVSISISLIAAFIPLLFMDGIAGRLLREFSVTLVFAIAVSLVVSLTVTPMICAHFVRSPPSRDATRLDRIVEAVFGWALRLYTATLTIAVRHKVVMLAVLLATVVLTVNFYIKSPKGMFPRDDTGMMYSGTRAHAEISFDAMAKLQQQAVDIVRADPAVANVGSTIGGASGSSVNRGQMFIFLKPLAQRENIPITRVIDRMRRELSQVRGLNVFLVAAQDIRAGARQSDSDFQFTLWSTEAGDLYSWAPKVAERMATIPGLTDISSDREQGGLQASITINRQAAARLGVRIQAINSALNNAFAQRQVSVIYTQRNQYRVVLEVDPRYQQGPEDLQHVFVPGKDGAQIPLTSVVSVTRTLAPLVVNHQGPFPAVTISYGITADMTLDQAQAAIKQAIAELHMPDSIRAEPAGDAKAFAQQGNMQALLIVAALLAVYIVLGVLYESLAHPLTIISTLPSAGLGALLALRYANMELSIIAFIGIILLIGIVKKNGIMLVDFALDAERNRQLSAEQAIIEAARERFRPIMMTTFAALLGAVPLALAAGPGSELRRPLGVAIIGGLLVSQVLTLYTTPIIYLLLDKLHRRLGGKHQTGLARGDSVAPTVPAE